MNKVIKTSLPLVLALLGLLLPIFNYAQGWKTAFPESANTNKYLFRLIENPDSSIVACGVAFRYVTGRQDSETVLLLKVDKHGNHLWRKEISKGRITQGREFVRTNDGGFLIDVYQTDTIGPGFGDSTFTYLLKVDSTGTEQWSKKLAFDRYNYSEHIQRSANGNTFDMVLFTNPDTFTFGTNMLYLRVDSDGNEVFRKDYPRIQNIGFNNRPFSQYAGGLDIYAGNHIIRLNIDGDSIGNVDLSQPLWTDVSIFEYATAPNGDIICTGEGPIQHTNKPVLAVGRIIAGGVQPVMLLDTNRLQLGEVLTVEPNGDWITSANWPLDFDSITKGSRTDLYKFNSHDSLLWSSTITISTGDNFMTRITKAQNGGYIILCNTNSGAFILKTDSYGVLTSNQIKGNLFIDNNQNCQRDTLERGFRPCMIQYTNGTSSYTFTDSLGNFTLDVDTGNTTIQALPYSNLWQHPACGTNPAVVHFGSYHDTTAISIPIYPVLSCPDLTVEVSIQKLQSCRVGTYTVGYCNYGSATATSAYVEVELDSLVPVTGSSIPWVTPQSGNVYRFNVGNLASGQCGSFTINVLPSCSAQLGRTFCAEAHIYPDSSCFAPSPTWDHSSVAVDAYCDGQDSVRFRIMNNGTGNMTTPLEYYIVEDNVMFKVGQFQLTAGASKLEAVKANGSTWTISAQQSAGHPGNSHPLKSVEACGVNGHGTFSTGFVRQFPQDDQDHFTSVDCHILQSSFDPNEKEVSPLGIGAQGYVSKGQPLKYEVEFQNTGNDTAYRIILRDTLSPSLDVATLQMNLASHPYVLTIEDSNVLVWTFDHIKLTDTVTNYAGSMGFVTFTIQQKANLQPGTVITNKAGIYFDNNDVVMTNTTTNTIVEDFTKWLSVAEINDPGNIINIYPNPTRGEVNIMLNGTGKDNFHLTVYDVAGHVVKQYDLGGVGLHTITDMNLQAGAYLFEVTTEKGKVGAGKLMVF